MKIELTSETIEKLFVDKKHLVEREASRLWGHFYVKTGVVSYEDFVQEGYKGLLSSLEYFSRSQSPMEAMDPYLVLGIQGELKNWIAKITRQFDYTFETPEQIDNLPEVLSDALPSFDDIEIMQPLSKEALDFLKTFLMPTDELRQKIKDKAASGKPYSRSILPLILEKLKMTYDDFNAIKAEIQQKCNYIPA